MEIALPGLLSSFVSFQLLSLNIYKLRLCLFFSLNAE